MRAVQRLSYNCCPEESESEIEADRTDAKTEHLAATGVALSFFLRHGNHAGEFELPKDTLFMACMVLPMIAWSSGYKCKCNRDELVLRSSCVLVRILLIGCLWLQSCLLFDLHRARVVFPSLDGVPHLCTYGQDNGCPLQPYGPNGIPFERNRGNIETNYMNVVMRNGLAKALKKLNMSNPDIGPVDYGMESSSCRMLCVAVLCMWMMRVVYTESRLMLFWLSVPKVRRCWEQEISCWKVLEIVVPVLYYLSCVVVIAVVYKNLLEFKYQDPSGTKRDLACLFFVNFGFIWSVWIPVDAPGSVHSWIQLEKDAERFVRSFENCKVHQSKPKCTRASQSTSAPVQSAPEIDLDDTKWRTLRSNFKVDLWSLLGRTDAEKVKFEPRSLPYIFFWCEAMPTFTLRLCIMLSICYQGVIILLNTGAIMDLILDTFAISFLLELEKLVYRVLADPWIPSVMANLQPFVLFDFCPATSCGSESWDVSPDRQTMRYRKGDKVCQRSSDWLCHEAVDDEEFTIEEVKESADGHAMTYRLSNSVDGSWVGPLEDETFFEEYTFVRYNFIHRPTKDDWYVWDENHEDPFCVDDVDPRCCCRLASGCFSILGGFGNLLIFVVLVHACHYLYFSSYCEFQKIVSWWSPRVYNFTAGFYTGGSKFFFSAQAMYGDWRSETVKAWDTGSDTCVPFYNISGHVRSASGCGQTPDPGL